MYKRSQPSGHDNYDYEHYGKEANRQGKFQAEVSNDEGTLEKFIQDESMIKQLKKRGIKSLFKIQSACFRPIYQGYDIIARDRTGSGKTLAFTLPLLERYRQKLKGKFPQRDPLILIILPTRELAMQVFTEIQSLRFNDKEGDFVPYVVYGKTSLDENLRKLARGVDILVGTPGRLNDLVERRAINLAALEVICLDQADEILKQGFKEEIEKIFSAIRKCNQKKIQTLLFSATIPDWLKTLSYTYQAKNTPYINMIKDEDIRTSRTIKHLAIEVSKLQQHEVVSLIQEMIDQYGGAEKRVLIFCEKKVQVDDLSKKLRVQNQPLHGDVAQNRRENAYRNFKAGSLKCIVATNVAARGLDFPQIDLIVQTMPPLNTEEFIHRAGRTGRAGRSGVNLLLFDRTRSHLVRKIQGEANIRIEVIRFDFSRLPSQRSDFNSNFHPISDDFRSQGRPQLRDREDYRSDRKDDRFRENDRNDRQDYRSNRDQGRGYQENQDRYPPRQDYRNDDRDKGDRYERQPYQSRDNQFSDRQRRDYQDRSERGFNRQDNYRKQENSYRREENPKSSQTKGDTSKRSTSRSHSRSKSRSGSRDRKPSPAKVEKKSSLNEDYDY